MPQTKSRYFTKTLFRLALECPTKLFYKDKKSVYADTSLNDEFLQALAEGGFQVGALAQVMHPEGVEVGGDTHQAQLDETTEFLKRDRVTLFEGAICHENLFARVDILRKDGDAVDLIEVKAKSFDSSDPMAFRNTKGRINSNLLPYLQDIAFQAHVFRLAFSQLKVRCFLMMPDKSKACTVDGLNQRFKISRHNGRPVISIAAGTDASSIGEPLLTLVNVDDLVDDILATPLEAPGVIGSFGEIARDWSLRYCNDEAIAPTIGSHCAKCEFLNANDHTELRSGLHECWQKAVGWSDEDFAQGSVLDLWKYRGKQALIERRTLKLADVTQEDLKYSEAAEGLSTSQRQWMQVSGRWSGNQSDFYLDSALMTKEMATWTFPLHFIDFETARVAIPLFKGQRPYANIAFQFSHHVVDQNGHVEHRSQFLLAQPGIDPNYEFVRQLKAALGNVGTVFMWSPHENTTLNAVLNELRQDVNSPADADELREFILSLTTRKEGSRIVHTGSRAMVDLCKLAERTFFHPKTKGSCSIKKVLPAVLQSSEYLKQHYSQPIYGAQNGIKSLNFVEQTWWRNSEGSVMDPYKLLPTVFSDLAEDILEKLESNDEMEIAQGGAATMAYARLQFEDIPTVERQRIEAALLRYCELDTLAMVIVYEAWREWLH